VFSLELSLSGTYTTEIVYAPDGYRFAKMNGQTLERAFVPLLGEAQAVYNSSGLYSYRHADWLGSNRLTVAAANRFVLYDAAYAPFGETYNSSGSDPSFTGQNQDTANGIYDFLFRQQSPVQGRWLVPDPAGLAAVNPANPQTWNRYAYLANNPLNAVDALGLVCSWNDGTFDDPPEDGGATEADCNAQGGTWLDNFCDPGTCGETGDYIFVTNTNGNSNNSSHDGPNQHDETSWLRFVSAANNGSWLQNAWNYLKRVPVNLTVIVPVLGIAGPAVTVTYLPQTNNLCVAPGLGASVGRNVSAGPLVLGNLANAKSITEGASISVGAQALPIAGAQARGNQSGILGGPTVGIPGGSVTATYGICF
jgi:RHS repeat-associated protein